jgi:beta-galactosidase/beta-glucuronidase
VRVANGRFFRALDNLAVRWVLQANGKPVESGTMDLPAVPPEQSAELEIPFRSRLDPDKEYQLNIAYPLKEAEPFLPAGHVLADAQFALQRLSAPPFVPRKGTLELVRDEDHCTVKGKNFSVEFDLRKGLLEGLHLEGQGADPPRAGARLLARAHGQRHRCRPEQEPTGLAHGLCRRWAGDGRGGATTRWALPHPLRPEAAGRRCPARAAVLRLR